MTLAFSPIYLKETIHKSLKLLNFEKLHDVQEFQKTL